MRMTAAATVLFLGAVSIFIVATPAGASSNCTDSSWYVGGCPNIGGELGDDEALLTGDLNGPGGGSGGQGGADGGGIVGTPIPETPDPEDYCMDVNLVYCVGAPPSDPGEPGDRVDPIMLSDIEAFRPTPPVQFMQPDGWMVVGLPTNFYTTTSAHTVDGELLGLAATVRFTPFSYRWRYGDGGSAALGTRGAPWHALGLREFDATATSHIYRASGTYVIDLDVDYTAEYRIRDGAWQRIPGALRLPANRLIATAGEAVTVLVDRDCATAPSGPGC